MLDHTQQHHFPVGVDVVLHVDVVVVVLVVAVVVHHGVAVHIVVQRCLFCGGVHPLLCCVVVVRSVPEICGDGAPLCQAHVQGRGKVGG